MMFSYIFNLAFNYFKNLVNFSMRNLEHKNSLNPDSIHLLRFSLYRQIQNFPTNQEFHEDQTENQDQGENQVERIRERDQVEHWIQRQRIALEIALEIALKIEPEIETF